MIINIPHRQVIDFYIDSVIEICRAYRGEVPNSSLTWLEQVLQTLPPTVFTIDEIQRLSQKYNNSIDLSYLGSELNIIYKRAKNHKTRS